MVLGAGRGTRLGALGRRVPKILVDVGGEPLLARQLAYLGRQGVDRAVVNAHHLAAQVRAFARAHRPPPALEVVVEDELLGTAGGVRNALPLLGDEPFLVLYGDVLVDEPLAPLLARHRASGAAATLACYRADRTTDKGVIDLAAGDRVAGFREKPPPGSDGPGWVNAGIYVVEPSLVGALLPGVPLDFGADVLPDALARGEAIVAHRLARPVLDVGTPEALALARSR
jgi:NDP-sugar pyrophosphorylase family protein